MVDENKVKLMTRLAIYEKHEKDKSLVYSKYFQSDYVRFNVLKTFVAATVVYWAVLGYYGFMNFDDLLAKISDVDYFDAMYKLLGAYVVFCAIYFLIATCLYNYRYSKAKPGLIQYNSDLRDLIELEGGPKHRSKRIKKAEGVVFEENNLAAENEDAAFISNNISKDKTRKSQSGAKQPGYQKNKKQTVSSGNSYGTSASSFDISQGSVSRSAMVRQRQMEIEKEKEEQIKQNAARLAERAKEKEEREKQAAADRRKIQERRRQLEAEQLERIRREQQQMMNRENHTYNGNTVYETNQMNADYSGNINRNGTGRYGTTNGNYEGRNR